MTTSITTVTSQSGLSAVAPETVEALKAALAASKAPATRRAYSAAWASWESWAREHGCTVLPATPAAVAAYLTERFEAGAGLPTLRIAVAALTAAHELAAIERASVASPCKARLVREAMRGFARTAADNGVTVKQARGLTAEGVATVRGHLNGRARDSVSAATTMALVSLTACAGLRRSECSALVWSDLIRESDGSGRVVVRRSKTSFEPAVVAVTASAFSDLERLRSLQAERAPAEGDGPVFASWRGGRWSALSGSTIGRRIKAACKAAGLGEGYSAHSGRVGMAQVMTRNQAPVAAVMRQGRWSSVTMVARYTRKESAAEALRYL